MANFPMPRPPVLDRILKKLFRKTPFIPYGRKELLLRLLGRPRENGFLFSHKIGDVILADLDSSSWIEQKLFYYGSYEGHILRLVRDLACDLNLESSVNGEAWAFWDVGANLGLYSFELASRVPRVVAFEPVPSLAQDLERLVSAYLLSNVHICQYGLASFDGCLPMRLPAGKNKGCGSFSLSSGRGDPVLSVRRADSVMQDLDCPVKLVKIDVEGFELEVLKGMANILRIHQPVLIIEYTPSLNNSNEASLNPLACLLPDGYRLLRIIFDGYSDSYRLERLDVSHVLEDTIEIIALPKWLGFGEY